MVSSSLPDDCFLESSSRPHIYQPVFSQQRAEALDEDPFERGAYNASRRPSNAPTFAVPQPSNATQKKRPAKRAVDSGSSHKRLPSMNNGTASSAASQHGPAAQSEPAMMEPIVEADGDVEKSKARPLLSDHHNRLRHGHDGCSAELSGVMAIPNASGSTLPLTSPSHNAVYTIDEALDTIGYGRFHVILLCLCGVGFAAVIAEFVLLGMLLPLVHCEWSGMGRLHQSLLPTVDTLLQIVGAWFWTLMSRLYGRRKVFIFPCLFGAVLGCISVVSRSYSSLVALRAGVGFCLGGHLMIDMAYYFESLPSRSRSCHSTILIAFGTLGMLYVSSIGMLALNPLGWRYFLFFCSLPYLVLFIFRVLWTHESVRYLARRGKMARAEQALMEMARLNGRALPPGKLKGLEEQHERRNDSDSDKTADNALLSIIAGHSLLAPLPDVVGLSEAPAPQLTSTGRDLASAPVPIKTTIVTLEARYLAASDDVDDGKKNHSEPRSPSPPSALLVDWQSVSATMLLSGLWFSVAFAYGGMTIWMASFVRSHRPALSHLAFPFLLMALSQLPGLALTTLCVDRLGRKFTLMLALLGCAIFTFLFSQSTSHPKHEAAIFYACMIHFFLIGAVAVVLTYASSLAPSSICSRDLAFAGTLSSAGGACSAPLIAILLDSGMPLDAVLVALAVLLVFAAFLTWLLGIETSSAKLTARDFVLYDGKFRPVNEKSQIVFCAPLSSERLSHSQRSSTFSSFSQ